MRKKLGVVLIIIILGVSATAQLQLFVSVQGNDHATGTLAHPLLTLSKAVQIAQQSTAKKITIFLRKGTYYPDSTIVIESKKLNNKIIQISGYKRELVTISGAKKIPVRWNLYNGSIYRSNIDISFEPDALFINGAQRPMARYPNYDSNARVFNGVANDAISDERVKRWKNPAGGFFHALHNGEWGSFHYQITGKDSLGKLMMIGGWQNNRPAPLHDEFRFVENIFEELDSPGEWYYNGYERMLYYFPLSTADLQEGNVELSCLKSVIHLSGSKQNPLKNIRISNIHFEHTRRLLMEQHEPLLRSDWRVNRGGAIIMEGTENCSIDSCKFSQLGATAIMVSGYNKGVRISNNLIRKIGGSGICFIGDITAVRSPAFSYEEFLPYETTDKTPGPKNNLFPQHCVADNNLIHDIGGIEKQATGVEISMSQNILVRHNTIYNTPRAGINIGDGTWGGHVIEYNDVFNTVRETGDHGAFNSWGRDRYWNANRKYMDSIVAVHPEMILLDAQATTVIRNNRFRCDHGWDIDLDDGSSNYHIYNNICLNGGLKLREGFDRIVENNIIINNSFHPHVWFKKSGDVFRYNIITRKYYPIAVPYWGKEIDYNFFPDSAALNDARKNNTDKNSGYGDPGFIKAATGNYQVQKNSLALAIGFKNIELDNFGVLNQKLKAMAQKVAIPPLILPLTKFDTKSPPIEWLDAVLRNVTGVEDKSAYGLSSGSGVIVVSINESIQPSGLQTKDVITAVEGKPIKDIFELMNHYQSVNWTGQMNVTLLRNQQETIISLKLK
ncbi:MAG: PDZ domain-containing protein [Chitinophagaceae bacterium]